MHVPIYIYIPISISLSPFPSVSVCIQLDLQKAFLYVESCLIFAFYNRKRFLKTKNIYQLPQLDLLCSLRELYFLVKQVVFFFLNFPSSFFFFLNLTDF